MVGALGRAGRRRVGTDLVRQLRHPGRRPRLADDLRPALDGVVDAVVGPHAADGVVLDGLGVGDRPVEVEDERLDDGPRSAHDSAATVASTRPASEWGSASAATSRPWAATAADVTGPMATTTDGHGAHTGGADVAVDRRAGGEGDGVGGCRGLHELRRRGHRHRPVGSDGRHVPAPCPQPVGQHGSGRLRLCQQHPTAAGRRVGEGLDQPLRHEAVGYQGGVDAERGERVRGPWADHGPPQGQGSGSAARRGHRPLGSVRRRHDHPVPQVAERLPQRAVTAGRWPDGDGRHLDHGRPLGFEQRPQPAGLLGGAGDDDRAPAQPAHAARPRRRRPVASRHAAPTARRANPAASAAHA